MNEFLYDINSGLIAGLLFISMLAAIEIGYRIGRGKQGKAGDAAREHINGIQASMLGILALLLGFTFSLSLQRYDSRSEAVVDEANAIGTAYLRAQLLPASLRGEVISLLREYVDLRVREGTLPHADRHQRVALLAKTARTQTALWSHARQAMDLDTATRKPVLFVESLNQLIDSFGRRDAALNRHVPELVLLLLYGTFLMTGVIVGYAAGIAGHRPSRASYILVALIVILVFIILDLDRPRRGFIQVSQRSLLELQASIRAEAGVMNSFAVPAATAPGR